ncbi:spore germination protein GerPB [Paenibacillus sp. GXUN7292]|uniref:spore germination protein GerPB n=1 Tax=Paenibacillus sp. GXUN7292 TaxID=3422499 RepID=UPI003D7F18A5
MNWTVYQHITINHFKVDNVSNSSVLQVGSAGSISGISQLYNTGGFVEPAPELTEPTPFNFVPLPNPV